MNRISLIILTVLSIFYGCSNGQNKINYNLSAEDFNKKLSVSKDLTLVDVRTPEEFSKGHLVNAQNIDYNGDNFKQEISKVDKTKPVYVYCLSGGRSGNAAKELRSLGYKEVYELDGGILKWRAANLPEAKVAALNLNGMTKEDFDKLTSSHKLVLVDFYADWCGPCKKMKPILDEIESEMKDGIKIIRINSDNNKTLMQTMHIDELPTFMVFNNGQVAWTGMGLFTKQNLEDQLK
jgi:thioredoxin 1